MYLSNLTFLHTYMLMENILIASGEVNYHVLMNVPFKNIHTTLVLLC